MYCCLLPIGVLTLSLSLSPSQCPIQALNCSVDELNVVTSECFEPGHRNDKLVKRLQNLIKRMLKANTVSFSFSFDITVV